MTHDWNIRTRPMFKGDDWQELRDSQARWAADTMSRVVGEVNHYYQRAAVATGTQESLLARALRGEKEFDLRTVYVAHGHMAAHWRLANGHVNPTLPGLYQVDRHTEEFMEWAWKEPANWFFENPGLIHLFAVVIEGWQSVNTLLNEMALWDELKAWYPLPPPENLDFFDDPASYSPYPKPRGTT